MSEDAALRRQVLNIDFVPPSLAQATQVKRLSDSIYSAELVKPLCVGTVPNGGYVASVMLRVAQQHLSSHGQPDNLKADFQFLGRTAAGKAYFSVEEAKMGRNMSVLHISLHQKGLLDAAPWIDESTKSKREVVAYVINTNLDKESGVSLPTGWTLAHDPAPVDFKALVQDKDPNWTRMFVPIMTRVTSLLTLEYYWQRKGHALRSAHDYWIRMASGERFNNVSLGFVADSGAPLIAEGYRQPKGSKEPLRDDEIPATKGFWYPTLTMSLDVKKKLKPEGVEWLRVRNAAKQIKNGRLDAEVIIFDDEGDIVALSHHMNMMVDVEKNYSGRTDPRRQKI